MLAHYALVKAIFNGDQLFPFALEHSRDWDSGPFGDDPRNIFTINFLFQHSLDPLDFLNLLLTLVSSSSACGFLP